ncbi:hypothetical protein ACFX11_024807 [Malus domestica]
MFTVSGLLSRHGKSPESLACRYFQRLIPALHSYHQNGVAQRDMKPHNLFVKSDVGRWQQRQKQGIRNK